MHKLGIRGSACQIKVFEVVCCKSCGVPVKQTMNISLQPSSQNVNLNAEKLTSSQEGAAGAFDGWGNPGEHFLHSRCRCECTPCHSIAKSCGKSNLEDTRVL